MNKKKTGPKQKHNNHKEWTRGWTYKTDAPENREWKKDRRKLFAEAGNGWWWYVGTPEFREHIKRVQNEMS